MLRQLTIALSFPPVIWRRLLSHFGLALAVWSGMTLAAGMVVSIPVYAEASGYRILLAALAERAIADPLPPFAVVYRYGGASDPSISWQQYLLADQLAGNLPAAGIDLPAPPGACDGEHIRAAPVLHAQCDGENDAGSLRLLSQDRLFRRVPEVPLNPTTGDA